MPEAEALAVVVGLAGGSAGNAGAGSAPTPTPTAACAPAPALGKENGAACLALRHCGCRIRRFEICKRANSAVRDIFEDLALGTSKKHERHQ